MPKTTRSPREAGRFSAEAPVNGLSVVPDEQAEKSPPGAGNGRFPIFRKQASDRVLEPGPTTVVVSTADRFKIGPLEPGPALPYLQDARRARCGRCGRQARHFVARADGIRWYCGKCRPGRAGELDR